MLLEGGASTGAAGAGAVLRTPTKSHPVLKTFDAARALSALLLSADHRPAAPGAPAALPADLPADLLYTDAVELFQVPEADPRGALRGQLGVRATRRIPSGELLGPYACHVCTFREYMRSKVTPVAGGRHACAPRHLPALAAAGAEPTCLHHELDRESFAHDYQHLEGTAWKVGATPFGGGLVADAFARGNEAAAVNDGALNPLGGGAGAERGGGAGAGRGRVARANVVLVEEMVHGFPFMFHAAAADIEPGEELLDDYGVDHWKAVQRPMDLIQRIFGAAPATTTTTAVTTFTDRRTNADANADADADYGCQDRDDKPSGGGGDAAAENVTENTPGTPEYSPMRQGGYRIPKRSAPSVAPPAAGDLNPARPGAVQGRTHLLNFVGVGLYVRYRRNK